MIIVITPFVRDKKTYRLQDLKRSEKELRISLPEPYWYSNTHPDVLCFMYGGGKTSKPDIIEESTKESILEFFEETYSYDVFVHIPYELHLNLDVITGIIKDKTFLVYKEIFDSYLEKAFIKYKNSYFQIPVTQVGAEQMDRTDKSNPILKFESKDKAEDITEYLATLKPSNTVFFDEVLTMPIGGWCGPAEALQAMRLRDEAYPFDYIRTELKSITKVLEAGNTSPEHLSDVLFNESKDGGIEYVHHNEEEATVRKTFVNRAERFIDRILNSRRSILYIRATKREPDLAQEIQQSRLFLNMVKKKYHRKNDKLLLIANFPDYPTGKLANLDDNELLIWNAMGVAGWNVPNGGLLITNYLKIIKHELFGFNQPSEPNYKSSHDWILV